MTAMATRSSNGGLSPALLQELERRRPGLARHMARAVVSLVHWDHDGGAPPQREAIARACEAGLDLFLATAREARPATAQELRQVAQLGILQARGSQSVEPVLHAYRIAARVAWDAILAAWRNRPEASPEALVVTADYVFAALDEVAAEVTRTYLHAREQHMLRGTRARTRLIHALISDTFDSELAIQKQALGLSFPLANSYVALVVKSEDGVADLLAGLDLPPRSLADITDPVSLVVLLPAEGGQGGQGDWATSLVEGLRAHGASRVRAGLGGEHPGLRGISRSYLEAQQAVEVGRKLRPADVLHQYDEVAPYLILAQNPLVAERYVTHVLGRLISSDPKGQMMVTLEALLASPSLKQTAQELHLHRHTILYRLERLRELVGADLNDPDARQRLRLALDLRRIL
ncbi:MAG TPA: helix-turn-helix domain-containing protein [Candidatus Acidoferrales bacterium]|nr:helix-turn-helix domain-containing protein [Candidatus Acidoferrales bacterium]